MEHRTRCSGGSEHDDASSSSPMVSVYIERLCMEESMSGQLETLQALIALACEDANVLRKVCATTQGCDALLGCCQGGINFLIELSERGAFEAWEMLVATQATALRLVAECIRDAEARERLLAAGCIDALSACLVVRHYGNEATVKDVEENNAHVVAPFVVQQAAVDILHRLGELKGKTKGIAAAKVLGSPYSEIRTRARMYASESSGDDDVHENAVREFKLQKSKLQSSPVEASPPVNPQAVTEHKMDNNDEDVRTKQDELLRRIEAMQKQMEETEKPTEHFLHEQKDAVSGRVMDESSKSEGDSAVQQHEEPAPIPPASSSRQQQKQQQQRQQRQQQQQQQQRQQQQADDEEKRREEKAHEEQTQLLRKIEAMQEQLGVSRAEATTTKVSQESTPDDFTKTSWQVRPLTTSDSEHSAAASPSSIEPQDAAAHVQDEALIHHPLSLQACDTQTSIATERQTQETATERDVVPVPEQIPPTSTPVTCDARDENIKQLSRGMRSGTVQEEHELNRHRVLSRQVVPLDVQSSSPDEENRGQQILTQGDVLSPSMAFSSFVLLDNYFEAWRSFAHMSTSAQRILMRMSRNSVRALAIRTLRAWNALLPRLRMEDKRPARITELPMSTSENPTLAETESGSVAVGFRPVSFGGRDGDRTTESAEEPGPVPYLQYRWLPPVSDILQLPSPASTTERETRQPQQSSERILPSSSMSPSLVAGTLDASITPGSIRTPSSVTRLDELGQGDEFLTPVATQLEEEVNSVVDAAVRRLEATLARSSIGDDTLQGDSIGRSGADDNAVHTLPDMGATIRARAAEKKLESVSTEVAHVRAALHDLQAVELRLRHEAEEARDKYGRLLELHRGTIESATVLGQHMNARARSARYHPTSDEDGYYKSLALLDDLLARSGVAT